MHRQIIKRSRLFVLYWTEEVLFSHLCVIHLCKRPLENGAEFMTRHTDLSCAVSHSVKWKRAGNHQALWQTSIFTAWAQRLLEWVCGNLPWSWGWQLFNSLPFSHLMFLPVTDTKHQFEKATQRKIQQNLCLPFFQPVVFPVTSGLQTTFRCQGSSLICFAAMFCFPLCLDFGTSSVPPEVSSLFSWTASAGSVLWCETCFCVRLGLLFAAWHGFCQIWMCFLHGVQQGHWNVPKYIETGPVCGSSMPMLSSGQH